MRPYTWLLDRVGDEGVKLTAAGFLPPAVVVEAMAVLEGRADWIGKGNREDLTIPVRDLRESAQQLRLIRRFRGRLVLSPAGRAMRQDPVALWRFVADAMPGDEELIQGDGGTLLLLRVAAGEPVDWRATQAFLARTLPALGWRSGHDEGPLDGAIAASSAFRTEAMLERLGLLPSWWLTDEPTAPDAPAREFARAALQPPALVPGRQRRPAPQPGPGRARASSGAGGLSDLDLARIRRWCDSRVPEAVRDQARVEYEVDGLRVTIVERRPPAFVETTTEWTRFPVARLRFDPSAHLWSLYWRDRNQRFHPYPQHPASPTVQDLLDEIAHDPTAIFWG